MNTLPNTPTPRAPSAWQRFTAAIGRLFGRKKSNYGDWLNTTDQGNAAGRGNASDDFMRIKNVDRNNNA